MFDQNYQKANARNPPCDIVVTQLQEKKFKNNPSYERTCADRINIKGYIKDKGRGVGEIYINSLVIEYENDESSPSNSFSIYYFEKEITLTQRVNPISISVFPLSDDNNLYNVESLKFNIEWLNAPYKERKHSSSIEIEERLKVAVCFPKEDRYSSVNDPMWLVNVDTPIGEYIKKQGRFKTIQSYCHEDRHSVLTAIANEKIDIDYIWFISATDRERNVEISVHVVDTYTHEVIAYKEVGEDISYKENDNHTEYKRGLRERLSNRLYEKVVKQLFMDEGIVNEYIHKPDRKMKVCFDNESSFPSGFPSSGIRVIVNKDKNDGTIECPERIGKAVITDPKKECKCTATVINIYPKMKIRKGQRVKIP